MKKALYIILKIILGLIICRVVMKIVNYVIGRILYSLVDNKTITMEEAAELLKSNIIIYLPFIVILIVFLINLFWDFFKNNKHNILWKTIVLILTYILFEFW